MSAPVSQLNRLSLDSMTPTTRSQARAAASVGGSVDHTDTESSSDSDIDSEASDTSTYSPTLIRSPTRLLYRLENLTDESRETVRDAFKDPPQIALQRCRRIGDTYAFQMTELLPRSVRIHASGDGQTHLSCSCQGQKSGGADQEACPHLLWLLDQLLNQTLYHRDHNRSEPFTMSPRGFAEEMGDPFEKVSSHHLDILAAGLHCPIIEDPQSEDQVDPTRALEARELLSSIYGAPPDDFRPDIFEYTLPRRKILKRNDINTSLFRMLVDNGHFFRYMLSLSRSSDPINDPFRKLSQRIDLILRSFDLTQQQEPSSEQRASVAWAANHLIGCVSNIRCALYRRDRPIKPEEALSASSTLTHVLAAVVARNRDIQRHGPRTERNLYLRLIGDRDENFVIDVLALIPEAACQFLSSLEDLLEQVKTLGAPATYVEKFGSLLSRLRTTKVGSRLKRQGQSQPAGRRLKRMR